MTLTVSFSMRDSGRLRELVLMLAGELDSEGARALGQRLRSLPEADVVVIDLRRLSFIDSGGLRLLVEAKKTRGDRLRIAGAAPPIAHVFETSGMAELLDES